MAVNNVVDPTKLRVGQVLIIPGGEIVEIHPLEVEQQEPEEWFETDEAAPLDYDQSLSLEDLESILFEEQEIPMVPVDDK